METIHIPVQTEYLILFDFDETYFPHDCLPEQLERVYEMEQYMKTLTSRHQVKTAWITGSSMKQIQTKMKMAGMTYLPHFISSNLGTDLWELRSDGTWDVIPPWQQKIESSGYSRRVVEELLAELKSMYNIVLHEQTQFGQSGYKMNYYYYEESNVKTQYDLPIIRHLASCLGIGININQCNPKAGDPEGAYDVDFIPLGTGKKAAVQFLIDYNQVPRSNTFAFGDSGNDLEMLQTVAHGYLLQNATSEAKAYHKSIAPYPYAEGILHVCRQHFKE